MLVDIEFWEQEWQQTKQEPKEANVAVQEEAAVVQAQAFVAASSQAKQGGAVGAGEARAAGRQQWQKSKGGDHVRGKQGYGHCSDHQFKVGGCKDKA